MSDAGQEPSLSPTNKSYFGKSRLFNVSINIGLVFIILGMLILLVAGDETRLTCNRTDKNRVDCQIQSTLFGLIPKGSQQVDNVRSATVGENCTSRGCTYRPELITSSGDIPLVTAYSAGTSAKQAVVNQINGFLNNPQTKSLSTSYGFANYLFLIPLLFIAFGFYAMIFLFRSRQFRP